jgi:hypothetical protein
LVSGQLEPGKYTLGMEFNREQAGKCGESLAKAKLYVNDKVVAEGDMKTQIATVFVSDLTAVTRSARNTDRPGNLRAARSSSSALRWRRSLEKLAAGTFAAD